MKLFDFIKYVFLDWRDRCKNPNLFNEYGFTIFCGRQGAGKTIGMVWYLEQMRKKYPNVIIVTNFDYVHQTFAMTDWQDLLNIRNGTSGVIFAIDEIQNEYSSTAWKDFPEQLLSQITQQRKQRIKIVATSQVFTRVVKQLREQAFEVVECKTWAGRWTHLHAFDAWDYNSCFEQPNLKNSLPRVWRDSFIQTNDLRNLYDSYEVIERMSRTDLQTVEQRKLRNLL